jgi:hypothetical protein
MAEAYFDNKLKDASVNVQRRQKTYDGFARLPEEFTVDDVMRCFNLTNHEAVRKRVYRLTKDHLIEKIGLSEVGTKYRKTGVQML